MSIQWAGIVGVIFLLAMVAFFLVATINELTNAYSMKRAGKLIADVYDKTPMTREQIDILSKYYHLTTTDTQFLLRNQFIKAIETGQESLSKYFQDLYEQFEKGEPFQGLPPDVRLHLQKIKEAIGPDKDHLMGPLVTQLQDISVNNKRKEKWMWVFTIAGLVVGVVGLIFGTLR